MPYVPKNTEQSSKWAMTNFREWFDSYNERNAENTCCHEEVLSPSGPSDVLCKWLCDTVGLLYVYSEKSSKNRQGGLYQAKMDHKTVTIVAKPEVKECCPVYLLDLYISKLPKGVVDNDLFYCKPMASARLDDSCPWYFNVPIGKNTLSKMVADMCAEAGFKWEKDEL